MARIVVSTIGIVAILSSVQPVPVAAQAWVGFVVAESGRAKSIGSCLSGRQLSAMELEEAKVASTELVNRFWRDAQLAQSAADGFQRVGTVKWIRNGAVLKRRDMTELKDPLAPRDQLQLVLDPLSFARAGAEPQNNARGIWRIVLRESPSITVGYWLVEFERFMLKWGISSITVFDSDAQPALVTPYCVSPGDIQRYADDQARRSARRDAKRAAKAKQP